MFQNKAWKQMAGLTPAEEGERAAARDREFETIKETPFLERLQDPRSHVLANRLIGALYELEKMGLKITDWFFDDNGSEVEFEDQKTKEKKWIQLGR